MTLIEKIECLILKWGSDYANSHLYGLKFNVFQRMLLEEAITLHFMLTQATNCDFDIECRAERLVTRYNCECDCKTINCASGTIIEVEDDSQTINPIIEPEEIDDP